ncbi:MAG: inorganic pyrophosphatase [Firmicutes bacterium]|nr:inorganic pyrophosphatase [Bacillota bacterium]
MWWRWPHTRSNLRSFLGRVVTVEIDRPLGSRHPAGHPIWYCLNYGYIPGTVSGDGAPIDAYLVGVFEPVERMEGVVIAVIERKNDCEDKLVVAPPGRTYSAEQIAALVEFQERFFDIRIITMSSLYY